MKGKKERKERKGKAKKKKQEKRIKCKRTKYHMRWKRNGRELFAASMNPLAGACFHSKLQKLVFDVAMATI